MGVVAWVGVTVSEGAVPRLGWCLRGSALSRVKRAVWRRRWATRGKLPRQERFTFQMLQHAPDSRVIAPPSPVPCAAVQRAGLSNEPAWQALIP